MAVINSNGTGGGNWSDGSSWSGGVAPGAGDRAVIEADDIIYIDGDITIGDGTTTTTVYAVTCTGDLVWRNRTGDAAASWTFTVDGHMNFLDGSHWCIGTEDNSVYGTESVGPIPPRGQPVSRRVWDAGGESRRTLAQSPRSTWPRRIRGSDPRRRDR